jgi:hypothetical protein
MRKPQDSDTQNRVGNFLYSIKIKFFSFSRDKKLEHYYQQINYVNIFSSNISN